MVDWVASALEGNPLNEARRIAESAAVAVMGRLSAYTGELVLLRDLLNDPDGKFYNATGTVLAESFEKGALILPPETVVPVPVDGAGIREKLRCLLLQFAREATYRYSVFSYD